MVKQILKLAMTCSLIFAVATQAGAAFATSEIGNSRTTSFLIAQTTPQAPPAGGESEQKAKGMGGPRKQLATIIFAGLGGALMGLSTLSFYGRPQDYLVNIPIGCAIGVIAGTAYVTYRAATNPQELYGLPGSPIVPEIERQTQPRGSAIAATTFQFNLLNLSF